MKRWAWMILVLMLSACDSATNMYNYGNGGGGGGFTNTTPPWHVTYAVDAAHNGSPPVDPNSPYSSPFSVQVLQPGSLTWAPYTFQYWTDKDPGTDQLGDGGGNHYVPGTSFTITKNMTLWAAWH